MSTLAYAQLRRDLYQRVLDRIDLEALRALEPTALSCELRRLPQPLLVESPLPLTSA